MDKIIISSYSKDLLNCTLDTNNSITVRLLSFASFLQGIGIDNSKINALNLIDIDEQIDNKNKFRNKFAFEVDDIFRARSKLTHATNNKEGLIIIENTISRIESGENRFKEYTKDIISVKQFLDTFEENSNKAKLQLDEIYHYSQKDILFFIINSNKLKFYCCCNNFQEYANKYKLHEQVIVFKDIKDKIFKDMNSIKENEDEYQIISLNKAYSILFWNNNYVLE